MGDRSDGKAPPMLHGPRGGWLVQVWFVCLLAVVSFAIKTEAKNGSEEDYKT